MPTLYVTEFANLATNERGGLNQIIVAPSAADQSVAVTGGSLQSAVFTASTTIIRLATDVACNVKFGTNPVATAVTMRLAAGSIEYIGVPQNAAMRVAVIAGS